MEWNKAKFSENFDNFLRFRKGIRRVRLTKEQLRTFFRLRKNGLSRLGPLPVLDANGEFVTLQEYFDSSGALGNRANQWRTEMSFVEESSQLPPPADGEWLIARLNGYEGNYTDFDEELILADFDREDSHHEDLFYAYGRVSSFEVTAFQNLEVRRNGMANPFEIPLDDTCVSCPDSRSKGREELQAVNQSLFSDALKIRLLNSVKLGDVEEIRRFKNNLSVSIVDQLSQSAYLAVACGSRVLFYCAEQTTVFTTNARCCLDTEPAYFHESDAMSATLEDYPYTINYVKSYEPWMGQQIIAVCADDGRILVWSSEKLFAYFSRFSNCPVTARQRIDPDFEFHLASSCWGVDFRSSKDALGREHHIVVGSSNKRTIKLFYLNSNGEVAKDFESEPVGHNIPDVSIVDYRIDSGFHRVHVCAASISGEVVSFEFCYSMEGLVQSSNVKINAITRTSENCWTARPIHKKFFRSVCSFGALTGNRSLNEAAISRQSMEESAILCQGMSPLIHAPATQRFTVPAHQWRKGQSFYLQEFKFSDMDDEYRRLRRSFVIDMGGRNRDPLSEIFIAVSTEYRGTILRGDTLLSTSSTQELFDFDAFAVHEEFGWSNRISLTLLIPELSAWVLATQAGVLSVLRFCQYREHYAIRQEFIGPDLPGQFESLKTIIGLTATNVSTSTEFPRFFLHVVFADGKCLSYELSSSEESKLDITNVNL